MDRHRAFDLAVAVLAFLAAVAARGSLDDPLHVALAAASAVPLVERRRWPIGVLAAVALAAIGRMLVAGEAPDTAVGGELVAIYTAMAYTPARTAVAAVAVAVAALAVPAVVLADAEPGVLVGWFINVAVAAGLGAYFRSRRLGTAKALAERERRADEVVAEERARIARELHDVVAHSVTVMGAQVGAARMIMTREPERAAEALTAAERAGRQAIAELRRMLGLLRESDSRGTRAPQPSLRQLGTLVQQVADAGLEVQVAQDPPADLPPGLDLAAYRIAQEALTNVLKHAPDARTAELEVGWRRDGLHIRVTNPGDSRQAPPPNGAGHGLVGIRERTALYGGTLMAGPRPDGGWELHAVLQANRSDGAS